MRANVLGVVGVLGGLGMLGGLGAARPAFADTSIDMGVDVGGMIGHGPLAARLDPMISIGMDATLSWGPWMLDAGFVFLNSRDGSATTMATATAAGTAQSRRSAADLDAIGWSAAARRHVAASAVGSSFVGAGYAVMALTSGSPSSSTSTRVGRLQGPKLTAGLDFVLNASGRRVGLALSASYQWLVASFDGGGRSYGGYAGLELTIVQGLGTCRDRTSWSCGHRF